MPLQKYKLSKNFKNSRKYKKSRKTNKTKKFRSSRKLKTINRKKNNYSFRNKSNLKSRRYQKGGTSCNLATVQEPAFNVDALGSIAGLSLAGSTAAIYRPNCTQSASSQAMVPS